MSLASNLLLRSVFDSMRELAVLVDAQGRIREFNGACETLTGFARSDVLGKELLPTLVPERWADTVGRRFADPLAPEVREPHENPWKTRSGEERLICWRCMPVTVPGEASPWILGLGHDATDERRIDRRLMSQTRLLDRFFDTTLTCAAILDPGFNFLRVNKAFADACGRNAGEFDGRNLFEMYPSDAKSIFEEVLRTGRTHHALGHPYEFPDHPEWGITYWDWTLGPVLDGDGRAECLVLCLNDVTAHQQSADRLRRVLEQLDSQSRGMERVREVERRRLALELHDEMGQELTALKLSIEGLCLPGDRAACAIDGPIAIIGRLQRRIRAIASHLRPPMLEEMGLLAALSGLFDKLHGSLGLAVSFRHSGLEARLPEEVETAAYRIVQEALTNVARHSGVNAASVLLRANARMVVLKVEDGGCGFEPDRPAGEGVGIAGMTMRARRLGGRLAIESSPGDGTSLTADLPLVATESPP